MKTTDVFGVWPKQREIIKVDEREKKRSCDE